MTDATKIKELLKIARAMQTRTSFLFAMGELHTAINALQARCDAAEKDCRTCGYHIEGGCDGYGDWQEEECNSKNNCINGSERKRVEFKPLWETK